MSPLKLKYSGARDVPTSAAGARVVAASKRRLARPPTGMTASESSPPPPASLMTRITPPGMDGDESRIPPSTDSGTITSWNMLHTRSHVSISTS